jgi:peptidoglycan/LPS O-acetylase OafA/YrhL
MLNVPFALQVVGVCLSVAVLYGVGGSSNRFDLTRRYIAELGKYSLYAYVVQIVALQLLRRSQSLHGLSGPALALPLLLAVLITVAAVYAMAALRTRSTHADRAYRAVFA